MFKFILICLLVVAAVVSVSHAQDSSQYYQDPSSPIIESYDQQTTTNSESITEESIFGDDSSKSLTYDIFPTPTPTPNKKKHHNDNHNNSEVDNVVAGVVIPLSILSFVIFAVCMTCILANKQGKLDSIKISFKKKINQWKQKFANSFIPKQGYTKTPTNDEENNNMVSQDTQIGDDLD